MVLLKITKDCERVKNLTKNFIFTKLHISTHDTIAIQCDEDAVLGSCIVLSSTKVTMQNHLLGFSVDTGHTDNKLHKVFMKTIVFPQENITSVSELRDLYCPEAGIQTYRYIEIGHCSWDINHHNNFHLI